MVWEEQGRGARLVFLRHDRRVLAGRSRRAQLQELQRSRAIGRRSCHGGQARRLMHGGVVPGCAMGDRFGFASSEMHLVEVLFGGVVAPAGDPSKVVLRADDLVHALEVGREGHAVQVQRDAAIGFGGVQGAAIR